MNDKKWFSRHWKLVLNMVTLAALFLLVYLIRDQIIATFRNLHHVNTWALLLMIPVEALNYHSQTRLYQRLFAIVGNRLSYKNLFKASLELNFVNHVFPSGGVSGISYFTLRLRDSGKISSGKATLIHIMKIALYFLAFEVLLVFGVLCLAAMGRANNLVILVAGSLSTLLLVGTVAFAYIIGSKQRINSFFVTITRVLNRIIKLVRPSYPETININKARRIFDDFHDNYQSIKNNYQQLKVPFLYALVADTTEILALYVVYIAFGEWVNMSVLPGGVGIYEALMTAVLAATGIPPALSLPVTVMYRVLNSILQLPAGYYFYHKALGHGERPPEVTPGG
jgi:uncharacterized membrane protein YbhN (UPF0104 family)